MSDDAARHLADAEQYWGRFDERVKDQVDSYLNVGPAFNQKSFNRYMLKLSKRFGVDMSETDIETTRGVLTENIKKDASKSLDDMAKDMKFVEKFAELTALAGNSPDDNENAIRNTQNAQMDMEMYKMEPTENYAKLLDDIAICHEDVCEGYEEELVGMVEEMTELRNWINKEIERKSSEKRNAHSEGNIRRAVPRRRSSVGMSNVSRRSIDPNL